MACLLYWKASSASALAGTLGAEADEVYDMVAFKLANAGHQVVRVVDGEAEPAEAARERPDVIILDVMMPVLDGFAVLARLRADPALPAIPVIMLTARSQRRDILTGLKVGAADCIVKPFSLKELLARVDVALRRG
jgi:DNA-binding response OmpR family regulator